MPRYEWREITLADMLDHFQGKSPVGVRDSTHVGPIPAACHGSVSGIMLSDGSVVVAESLWSGPYSKDTPDIDADPPRFWIGIPSK